MLGRWLWGSLKSVLVTLALLLVVLALFMTYRVVGSRQQDNAERIANKQQYLAELSTIAPAASRPNIIFILYDDMGYGDIGAGVTHQGLIHTPNIDRLAQQGVTFNNFYSAAPSCTPARASFLTGRLPVRAGLPYVVFPSGSLTALAAFKLANPDSNVRLPSEEITLAEILHASGYRTGMVGKWHLGDRSPSLPNDFGFDSFFGSLYSNDMQPFALYRNRAIEVPAPADQRYLSERYDREVLSFLGRQSDKPFFLYLAHNFPHDPLSTRKSRLGKSDAGLYGDVLEELDEGVGNIVEALEARGQLDNTLIIISSDNGPWFLGNAGHQRGRKGSTFEGGMRVPFIVHWPERIPGHRLQTAMAMGTDLLPTILDVLGLPAPPDRILDGNSMLPLLTGRAQKIHDYLYFYEGETLFATRDQRYKYRAPNPLAYGTDEIGMKFPIPQKAWLFDLEADPGESYDTSARYPDEVKQLRRAFDRKTGEMADNPRGWR